MQAIVQRLETEIKPQADRVMTILLQVLQSLNNKSSVADSVFAAVGALANATEDDFNKYMEAFTPFLFRALSNQEDAGLCSMAIGLVSDIVRSISSLARPFCDNFMNYLLENLRVHHPVPDYSFRMLKSLLEYSSRQSIQAGYSAMLWRYRPSHWWRLRGILVCRSAST